MTADADMTPGRTSSHNHTRTSTLDAATLAGVSEIFKILGDPTRMLILSALARKNLCVQEIASEVGVTQSAISHQLRMLKTMRLVASKRTGKKIVYSLADKHVDILVRTAIKHYAE
jgi:ArsR family transcriptional regulator, lead/cadmium/zinc/bismuth-responsive transcriptional repressor